LSGKFVFPDGEMPERYQQVEDDVTDEEDEPFAEMLRAVLRLGYMMGADDAFSGRVRVDQGSRGDNSGESFVDEFRRQHPYLVFGSPPPAIVT
jgi:hypothetical protein